jgi:cytochrome c556
VIPSLRRSAKLVTRPGSGYADDVGFLNHAAGLGAGAVKLKAAAAQRNIQVLRAAITFTSSRCTACHSEYR